MRIKVISCEVLYRELSQAAARSPHKVDVQFLTRGLHDDGCRPMRLRVQAEIDKSDVLGYEAIVLGYGLCGNGTVGLAARTIPLVIPRAHDCSALLMGGREKFQEHLAAHPGVQYRSTGWVERGQGVTQLKTELIRERTGEGYELEDLISRYGEETGRYLFDQFNTYKSAYTQLTYIQTGVEPDARFERAAQKEAVSKGLKFEKIPGSMRIFDAMVSGEWSDEDFLVVPPGHRVKERFDDKLIDSEQAG